MLVKDGIGIKMKEKDIVFYHKYKLHFWAGSWDVYNKENKYILRCFRYLKDAKKYVDEIEETLDNE